MNVAASASCFVMRMPRPKRLRLVRVVMLACSLFMTFPGVPVRAQEPSPTVAATERSVKAAFLYKFLGYVDWPPSAFAQADAPVVIGVVGADDIAAELGQITAGRAVDGHPIVVRRLRDADSLNGVHMLFVGRNEAARLGGIMQRAQQRSILTVAETPGGLEQGAIINFLLADGRVRFEISVESAEKSGLKLSSRLLAVAQSVRTGAGS